MQLRAFGTAAAWLLGLVLLWVANLQCDRDYGRMEGANLYRIHCANCHMENGQGLGALIPPLAKSDYLLAHREQLPCIIRYGLKDTIVVNGTQYAEAMAGIENLSDVQITNILNYVNSSWGNDLPPYRLDEVQRLLQACR
ncbi:MAG: cytochrome c [Saprospiraceae bacterium]|nr:cytochrome c [Saprospiraceae bacterium]MDW8482847.1 cytochrome c [Saprospiraceae bacterium]